MGRWSSTAPLSRLDQLLATLQDRRSLLTGLLGDRLPELTWQPAPATYLAWLDCSALGDGDAGREFFLEHAHVALEPGLSFGPIGSGYASLNFGTSAEVLDRRPPGCARPWTACRVPPPGRVEPGNPVLVDRPGQAVAHALGLRCVLVGTGRHSAESLTGIGADVVLTGMDNSGQVHALWHGSAVAAPPLSSPPLPSPSPPGDQGDP